MRTVLVGAVVAGMVGTIFAAEAGPATAAMTAGGATGVTRVAPATEPVVRLPDPDVRPATVAAGVDYVALLNAAVNRVKADPLLSVSILPSGVMTVSSRATPTELVKPRTWMQRNGRKVGWGGLAAVGLFLADRISLNNPWGPYRGAERDWLTGQPTRAAEEESPDVPQVSVTVDNRDNRGNNTTVIVVSGEGGDGRGGSQENSGGEGGIQ